MLNLDFICSNKTNIYIMNDLIRNSMRKADDVLVFLKWIKLHAFMEAQRVFRLLFKLLAVLSLQLYELKDGIECAFSTSLAP